MRKFVNILYLPPPDCRRCEASTNWAATPLRFRPEGSRLYSGCRGLCHTCYSFLRTQDPARLDDYPRKIRRCTDVYAEYLMLRNSYPRWTKREIATELIGISHTALDQAIVRARRLEQGLPADPGWARKKGLAA